MPVLNEKTVWSLVATGAAIGGAVAARSLLRSAWTTLTEAEPPENPADPEVSWGEALAWTALTGAVVGVARMLAMRAATSGWERTTGHLPPL